MTNAEYVKERNKLIPEATAIAKKRVQERIEKFGNEPVMVESPKAIVAGMPNTFVWSFFTEYFFEEMNRLAIEKGLVRG